MVLKITWPLANWRYQIFLLVLKNISLVLTGDVSKRKFRISAWL